MRGKGAEGTVVPDFALPRLPRYIDIPWLRSARSSMRRFAPLLIALCTGVIFVIDLHFPIGFAPWLPYFILAFATARLYEPKTLMLAALLWSFAIMGEPFLPPQSGEPLSVAVLNRTMGVITLWILTGLLSLDSRARRARQTSEHTLRETSSFIESLFEHLPIMVFVKDAKDLRFVRLNKAGEELLGHSRAELLGKNSYDIFPKNEADFFTAKDRKTLSGDCLVDIPEEPVQTRTRGIRLLHTKKIPVCDENGAPRYLLGISEDVTERNEAEAVLVRARLAAEEANKAKSDFLANMSHEMRTPLNAIMGIMDFLRRTSLNHEQLVLVERCTKASEALLRMIEDLLLTAKAESGTLALLSEPFMLRDVIADSVKLLATEASRKGLTLTLRMDPAIPTHVMGDADRLQQVLLNLIRNAVKFTSTGSIGVQAKVRSLDHGRCTVQFVITDTGIGISDELRERLFQRFSQADSRTIRQYGGVGLGLSICRQLVDLMGGRIWVESRPGSGSSFGFTVPLGMMEPHTQSDPVVPPNRTLSPRHPAGNVAASREVKILLAEDSLESQYVMRLYLSRTPYRLDCTESGARVVEAFTSGRYDLVLMDLHMPDMDGCEATRLIRAWEKDHDWPRTPIVALTADGFTESKEKSLEAGCDDFLTKPIKMDAVLSTIRRYLSDSQAPFAQDQPRQNDAGSLEADLRRLRPQFIRKRRDDVLALRTAIDANNFDQIRTIGHRIKGLAGSYGLHAIGVIGGVIEQAAMQCQIDRVTTGVAELVEAIREAEQPDPQQYADPASPQSSKGARS